jgi:hypothetical protein
MSESSELPSVKGRERVPPGALGAWWREGARSAFFLAPSWSELKTGPTSVAWLIAVPYFFGILLERLYIAGDATFYWPAFQIGWLSTALTLWICWIAIPGSRVPAVEAGAPSAVALFSMLAAQLLTMQGLLALFFVPLARTGSFSKDVLGPWGWWAACTGSVRSVRRRAAGQSGIAPSRKNAREDL